jgi:hypothetical protein
MPILPQKSLADLEEEEEYTKQRRRVLEEKVAIRELEQRMGKGSWRHFSMNGKKSGLNVSSIINWLKNQGGGSKKR